MQRRNRVDVLDDYDDTEFVDVSDDDDDDDESVNFDDILYPDVDIPIARLNNLRLPRAQLPLDEEDIIDDPIDPLNFNIQLDERAQNNNNIPPHQYNVPLNPFNLDEPNRNRNRNGPRNPLERPPRQRLGRIEYGNLRPVGAVPIPRGRVRGVSARPIRGRRRRQPVDRRRNMYDQHGNDLGPRPNLRDFEDNPIPRVRYRSQNDDIWTGKRFPRNVVDKGRTTRLLPFETEIEPSKYDNLDGVELPFTVDVKLTPFEKAWVINSSNKNITGLQNHTHNHTIKFQAIPNPDTLKKVTVAWVIYTIYDTPKSKKEMRIVADAINPEFSSLALATTLVRQIVEIARKLGAKVLTCDFETVNLKKAAFAAYGFQKIDDSFVLKL